MRLDEVISNRPVSPMHFREGTSCLSMKWNNDWWGLGNSHFDGEAVLVLILRDLLFVTVTTVYWWQTREGSILIISLLNQYQV